MRFGSLFNGKSFFEPFQSSLAGARRGQVVAVLVLGPKPQPLLVLLLWFFGSVLSRATWEEGETGDETLALLRRSATASICSGCSFRQTFKTRAYTLAASLSRNSTSWSSAGQHKKKGEQCVSSY